MRGSLTAVLLSVSMGAWPASAPIAIVLPTDLEAQTDPAARETFGVLVYWLESSGNKKSAQQIARFHFDLADPDFGERLAKSLSCIGEETVTDTCQKAILLMGNTAGAIKQLKSMGSERLLLIRVHPLKTDLRIRMRAIVTDILIDSPQTPRRVFTALYEARVPAEIEAQFKKEPEKAAAWWAEGSPSRMQAEVGKGIEELRQMLTRLDREVPQDNSVPPEWNGLPNTEALKKAGRLKCSGGGCDQQRVLRDAGDRAWLAFTFALGAPYGWSIVSFDDATASRNGHMSINVQTSGL